MFILMSVVSQVILNVRVLLRVVSQKDSTRLAPLGGGVTNIILPLLMVISHKGNQARDCEGSLIRVRVFHLGGLSKGWGVGVGLFIVSQGQSFIRMVF